MPNSDTTIRLTDWEFTRSKTGKSWFNRDRSENLQWVCLPHTYNLHDTFQYDVSYYRGWGSYRCSFTFTPDVEHPHAFLVSNGFYGTGQVWLDGKKLCDFDAQYLGLRIPLHDLRAGKHTLGIRLTNKCAKHVLPGIKMPDFVLYGGLACDDLRIEQRSEAFLIQDELQLVPTGPDSYHLAGEVKKFKGIAGKNPMLKITVAETDVTTSLPLTSPAFDHNIQVQAPIPWSTETPHLYDCHVQLSWDDGEDDTHTRRIGFRTIAFTPDRGFLLNDEPLFLRGCNRHESMPGFGNALSIAQHREDAKLLKDMGANIVRLSHYPQHPAFLEACDEFGLLVYAEIATWKSARSGKWLENAKRQMRDMILRDGHHPSFILWGLGNETRKRDPFMQLQDVVRSYDPHRPTIYAENHIYRGRREDTLDLTDVFGVNYELDLLEEALDVSKNGCALVSECSSYPTERGDFESERAQVHMLIREVERITSVPGIAGFTLWCFADYATLRKKRYKRFSGLVDAWRVPKPAYDYFRGRFSDQPVLALHGPWMQSLEGSETTVVLVTNQPSGHITLNGETCYTWTQAEPLYHELKLSFQAETLRAEAGDLSATLEPFDFPADQVVVEPYDERSLLLRAVDEQGRTVSIFNQDVWVPNAEQLLLHRPDGIVEFRAGTARVFPRDMHSPFPGFDLKQGTYAPPRKPPRE